MKKCKLCGERTNTIYNIKLKAISVCGKCGRSIMIQELEDVLKNTKATK